MLMIGEGNKNSLGLLASIAVVSVIVLLFEAGQQYFYVDRFKLVEDPSFFDILRAQFLSWLVWLTVAVGFILGMRTPRMHRPWSVLGLIVISLGLVALCVVMIAFIHQLRLGAFDIDAFFSEFLPFYAFQKGPIYTLGFAAVGGLSYYYHQYRRLSVELIELEKVKEINQSLEQQLTEHTDNNSIKALSIKVGQKVKIIPLDSIIWIEADDYCVKVHIDSGPTYSMRKSLLSLEQVLSDDFIRVHRGAIANMLKVREIDTKGAKMIMLNDDIVPVSKSKMKSLRENFSTAG